MMDLLASAWIPTVMLLLLACGARLLSESWLAPGPFALLTWSIYLVVPLTLAPEYKVAAAGPWVILLLVVCIAIGADLGVGADSGKSPKAATQSAPVRTLLHLNLFLSGLGLLGVFYSAAKALTDYSLELSLPGLLALGRLLSVERYAGEQPPLLVRALVIWIFSSALLGGMTYIKAKTRSERLLCFTPLLPALLSSLVQAARSNTLIVIALWLSGYLAMRVVVNTGPSRLVSRKGILVAAASVTAGLSFFFAVNALRSHKQYEDIQVDQVDTDWGLAKSTSLGYLAVFSHWAKGADGLSSIHASFGVYTFGGLVEMTGLHPRQAGVYGESLRLQGDDSNIYTAFRGLIEDFSLVGAMVFCFLMGILSGHAYRSSSGGSETGAVGLAAFYCFLFWSPIISVFLYNGPILAILVSAFALTRLNNRWRIQTTSTNFGRERLRTA
jgi:oligosaccharide repeat unit polymerase